MKWAWGHRRSKRNWGKGVKCWVTLIQFGVTFTGKAWGHCRSKNGVRMLGRWVFQMMNFGGKFMKPGFTKGPKNRGMGV